MHVTYIYFSSSVNSLPDQRKDNRFPSCHHSYKQLPVVHSFLPEIPTKPRNIHNYNSNKNNSNPVTGSHVCDSYYIVTQNHIRQTTIRAIPCETQNSATILRSPKLCQQMNDGCIRSSLKQQSELPAQTVLNYKESLSKTRVSVSDTWDDDVTTTSGSYVVDPDELWQYSDEMS